MTTKPQPIETFIHTIRGQRVILDSDLARLYGVTTKRLNEQVKRNRDKFPEDFAFQLTPQEVTDNWSQIATGSPRTMRSQIATASKRNVRFRPHVFTEHGAIMAANVLNSASATQMSVFVVRAFIKMRAALTETRELARKLADLEKKLTDRLDTHEHAIVDVLEQIMRLLNPPSEPIVEPPPKRIGFGVREPRVRYGSRREEVAHV